MSEVCGPDGCEVPATGRRGAAAGAGGVARIDVVSDAICPWCWVGKRNLEGALALLAGGGRAVEVHWRPFQLNPDMPKEGVGSGTATAPRNSAASSASRELDAQVAASGRATGVEFRHALMLRMPNTVDAHRVIRLAGLQGPAVQDKRGGGAVRRAISSRAATSATGRCWRRSPARRGGRGGLPRQRRRRGRGAAGGHGLPPRRPVGVPTFALRRPCGLQRRDARRPHGRRLPPGAGDPAQPAKPAPPNSVQRNGRGCRGDTFPLPLPAQ